MSYGKRSFVFLCVSICWLTCVSSAATNSSALNATSKSNSSTIAVNKFSPVLLSSLLKSNRTKASNHTITSSHPKGKVSSLIGKLQNITHVGSVNLTQASERLANLTSSAKFNSTHTKNFGSRFNSTRLLERFSSKHSLLSLASTGVSNKTLKAERDSPANVTLDAVKNSTKSANKTIEKRAIARQDVSNKTSNGTSITSVIHSIPDLLSNATNNVTNWAKKLLGFSTNSSSAQNITSKKVGIRSVKLELSDNSTQLNETFEKSSDVNPEDVEERRGSKSNSSLLNADVVTIKRDVSNKTLNVSSVTKQPKVSSMAKNFTNTEIKHKTANLNLNTLLGLNKTSLTNVTLAGKMNGSLVNSSVAHKNRTRRHLDGHGLAGRAPNSFMAPGQLGYPNAVPASYASAPAAPAQGSYGMAPPAPVYGPPAAPYITTAPAYAMGPSAPVYSPPAPLAPVYGQAAYSTPAPVYEASPAALAYPQPESYYTAPPPTTYAPYANQPMSYSAQPYGSAVPPRQSATQSPWF